MAGITHDNVIGSLATAVKRLGVVDLVKWDGTPTGQTTGGNIVAAVFPTTWAPYPGRSGLNVTSIIATSTIEVVHMAATTPLDGVTARLQTAVSAIIAALNANIDLDLTGTHVDIIGEAPGSNGVTANWGWLPLEDGNMRACDITAPIILDDVYPQGL